MNKKRNFVQLPYRRPRPSFPFDSHTDTF